MGKLSRGWSLGARRRPWRWVFIMFVSHLVLGVIWWKIIWIGFLHGSIVSRDWHSVCPCHVWASIFRSIYMTILIMCWDSRRRGIRRMNRFVVIVTTRHGLGSRYERRTSWSRTMTMSRPWSSSIGHANHVEILSFLQQKYGNCIDKKILTFGFFRFILPELVVGQPLPSFSALPQRLEQEVSHHLVNWTTGVQQFAENWWIIWQ